MSTSNPSVVSFLSVQVHHLKSMNCLIITFFIIINVSICLHLWLNWKSVNQDLSSSSLNDEFIPTNEWKPLKKDQPIPKGLHVRINLQTGEREAKLLEVEKKEKVDEKYPLISLDEGETNVGIEDAHKLKYELLKESLKNIEPERLNRENAGNDNQSKKKFRTYEQLKEELREVNINIKTDVEVLDDLFKVFSDKYKNTGHVCSTEDPELESILKNLENLLHQVDNAEEFCKRNGIIEIILPCLSSNSTSMKTASARVLGAATQNNPKVQIDALRAGVITPLLKTVALTKNYEARASSIFALSCMIRSFPFAEMKLIEEGGLDVLLSLFEENSADALKLQMKVINLFYDLTLEKDDAEETVKEEKLLHNITVDNEILMKEMQQMQERLKQYKEVDLKTKLIERGWCSKLSHVLSSTIRDTHFAHTPDVREDAVNHDVIDKVSRAMLSFAVECRQQFVNEKGLVQVLKNLLTYYERLITNDELYKDMYSTLQKLNTKLNLS